MPTREKLRSPRLVQGPSAQMGQQGRLSRRSGRDRGTGQLQLLRWRRKDRDEEVQRAIEATKALRWSPELMEVLLEELCVDEWLDEHFGRAGTVSLSKVPRVLAAAVILRHSWHPDDLDDVLRRLGISRVF